VLPLGEIETILPVDSLNDPLKSILFLRLSSCSLLILEES